MTEQTLSSWDVEDDEVINGNLTFDKKTGLHTKIRLLKNEKGQSCQETLQYKLVTYEVSESVKARRMCNKFGKAANDPPGPNPSHTFLGDEIFMKFYTDEVVNVEEEGKAPVQTVRCRNCQGDHFSHKCPYKEEIKSIQELSEKIDGINADATRNNNDIKTITEPILKPVSTGAYIPPSMRDGAQRNFQDKKRPDSSLTIRVSNLPETTQESDLNDLFRPFGSISRTFLVRDRQTGLSRGFAYVTFSNRFDAAKAIELVNGYGYDHCILQVQWSE